MISITAVWAGDTFPDRTYEMLQWTREWTQILTTRESYGFLASEQRISNEFSVPKPPFILRKQGERSKPYRDAEGYRVLKAWLGNKYGDEAHVSRDALEFIEPPDQCFTPEMEEAYSGALLDFSVANSTKWFFDFRDAGHFSTVEHGKVSFSAIGFNSNRTIAILFASYTCGLLCGRGTYYILSKVDGRWGNVVEVKQCGWVS